MRLTGGTAWFEGRVEVCSDQNWGTVCDHNWDDTDALVACRQRGYYSSSSNCV